MTPVRVLNLHMRHTSGDDRGELSSGAQCIVGVTGGGRSVGRSSDNDDAIGTANTTSGGGDGRGRECSTCANISLHIGRHGARPAAGHWMRHESKPTEKSPGAGGVSTAAAGHSCAVIP